jgi:hypothetical protein
MLRTLRWTKLGSVVGKSIHGIGTIASLVQVSVDLKNGSKIGHAKQINARRIDILTSDIIVASFP